jgi:DNA-directed RNA polymerase specialized sigma24 family protein
MQHESVSEWIAQLKSGEHDAAQKLWHRYADRLVALARRRLYTSSKTAEDEEDVVQSVFESICRGAAAGRFELVTNRDELWWLLLAVTKRKAIDRKRREMSQKRGGGLVHLESHLNSARDSGRGFTLDNLIGADPTPDELSAVEEQCQHLLGILRDESLRQIAVSRIEGYEVSEIAQKFGLGERAVERKLRLIRDTWRKEMDQSD